MKYFKKVFLVFLIVSYFISGTYVLYNSWVIENNTDNFQYDSNVEKVKMIKENDSILLENGNTVEGSKIENYIKVNKGVGTWYIEEGNSLVVEITYKDYIRMYTIFSLIGLILLWIIRKKLLITPFIVMYFVACVLLF